MGDVSNKDLLLSFINAVHEDYGFPLIKSVKIINPFNLKEHQDYKETIIDVKATDENGTQYDIEVQVSGNEVFKSRSLYYWAKLYSSQLDDENATLDYKDLKPTICINLVNFNLIKDYKQVHSCFLLKEMNHPKIVLTDHLIMHYIELPKFTKHENFKSHFEKWLAFFKYEGKEEAIMKTVFQDDPIMNKAHETFKQFTKSEMLMDEYEGRIKYRLDMNTALHDAEEKATERGLEQGKLDTAKEMKADGLAINKIVQYTGLSEEVVRGL